MMLIGYARVSTAEQNLDLQLDALKGAGCERIFTDTMSGAKADRPGWSEALAFARPGDVIVVWKLDRLGRTMRGLVVDVAETLRERELGLRSLTDGIDTGTTAGRFFFNIMAALAAMERDLILERTRAGLDVARRQGKVGGRRPVMTEAKKTAAARLLESGTPAREVAETIGVSVATLYRHLPATEREE